MSKFKVGDKVRRIGVDNNGDGWCVPVGHVDVVASIQKGWLSLVGVPLAGMAHDAQLFELAETPFKVGDRVVAIKEQLPFFGVGDVGVVLEVGGIDFQEYFINFDAQGNQRVHRDGQWYADRSDLTLAPPRYSSTFSNPVAKAEPTTGHAESGGLQKHSIGDIYPLAVVGYGHEPMIYVLENLETGEVCCWGNDYVRQWQKPSSVYDFAKHYSLGTKQEALLDSDRDAFVWVEGRPYNVDGVLYMPVLSAKYKSKL